MIRRTVLAVAAAAALILSPSATMAQTAPVHTGVVALPQVVVGFTCTVSTSTPQVGGSVNVLCSRGNAYQSITLRVDGTKALTKQLSSGGAGTFLVKFTAPATHTLTMTNVAGTVLVRKVVRVGFSCTVSTSTPAAGDPVKVFCSGGNAYQSITPRIDGTRLFTQKLDSNGHGTFTVRVQTASKHTLTMTSSAGTVLFTAHLAVHPKVVFKCTVSTSTPAAGAPVKVLCSGGHAYQSITLRVDRIKVLTKKLDSKGHGTFAVSIKAVGKHTLTMTSSAGTVLFTAHLVVHPKVVFKCTLSTLRPAAGEPVKVLCSGGTAYQSITLKVDGIKSLTKTLNSKGQGTFTVSIKAVGKHTLTMTNSAGKILFTAHLLVHPKYPASRYSFTVTDSTPGAGVPFTANMTGGPANTAIVLTVTSKVTSTSKDGITIAGTKSITRIRNANSEAAFAVTLTEPGAYTLVVTNSEGVSRGAQTVTVAAAPAATVGSLSRTGFDPLGLLVGGGLLLLAGTGAVLAARRRKSAQVSV